MDFSAGFPWLAFENVMFIKSRKTHPISFFLFRWNKCSAFCHLTCTKRTSIYLIVIVTSLISLQGLGVDCTPFDLQLLQVVCFEWVSIPRLPRRLGNHDRWPPLIAVTPVDQWRPLGQLCLLSSLFLHEAVQKFVYGRCRSCSSECHCPG